MQALKGVSLRFRKNEFVSVLGASGCGKTTLLNIIGGLDHYTSGDLVICGVSTKDYKDRDWDVYRNHRIGFVFQSYNLIPHQTVLGNVELALTIAGISKAERRRRAEEALEKVGLKAELHKRPNQLSGGQMQRVAIARALVNNPEILLADEPTGALDTTTSIQIMELIREIAGERLVIMVTHNPELAEQYSSRIVRLQDGLVISDSNPYEGEETSETEETVETANGEESEAVDPAEGEEIAVATHSENGQKRKKPKKERSAMSFVTSLGLSARNLLTKKGRTAITSVAGSIGIISVCLVLALSNGFNDYILQTEEDMLSRYPVQIKETTTDVTAIISGMSSAGDMPDLNKIGDRVYVNSFLTNMAQGMTVTNDLSDEYLQYIADMDDNLYAAISYETGMELSNNLFTEVSLEADAEAKPEAVMSLSALQTFYTQKLTEQEEKYAKLAGLVEYLGSIYGKMPGTSDFKAEDYGDYVLSQYEVVAKSETSATGFPSKINEAVLVIGDNNDMTDLTLARLGILSETEFMSLFPEEGEEVEDSSKFETMIGFDRILNKKFMLNYNDSVYSPARANSDYWYDYRGSRGANELLSGEGIPIEISGILRLREGHTYGCLGSGLYFTEALCSEYLKANVDSQIAKSLREQAQMQPLVAQEFTVLYEKIKALDPAAADYQQQYNAVMTEFAAFNAEKGKYFKQVAAALDSYYIAPELALPENVADAFAELKLYYLYGDTALRSVGGKDTVNGISIYAENFENKEKVLGYLDAWNDSHDKSKQVRYTDTIGMIMTMVESMLNAITYVLVAFTAISLVVSSVMIGIITYVSVVERTKEIGVLRSLGARKKDIKNLFNAETFIIGLASGTFGVAVTYLLSIAINAIFKAVTGIGTLAALPFSSAFIMICVSVGLTLISGLIPAQAAAKKDPVIALRTE